MGGQMFVEPDPETRNWRQGGKFSNAPDLGRELIDDALDQEAAETDPVETPLAVRDRVEDRRVRLVRLGLAARREQNLDVVGDALGQRDLDEDQRLVRHAGMEIGVAPAVGA